MQQLALAVELREWRPNRFTFERSRIPIGIRQGYFACLIEVRFLHASLAQARWNAGPHPGIEDTMRSVLAACAWQIRVTASGDAELLYASA